MEEACTRLKKEIESLKEQNKQLEQLYITNNITRASTTKNDQEFAEW